MPKLDCLETLKKKMRMLLFNLFSTHISKGYVDLIFFLSVFIHIMASSNYRILNIRWLKFETIFIFVLPSTRVKFLFKKKDPQRFIKDKCDETFVITYLILTAIISWQKLQIIPVFCVLNFFVKVLAPGNLLSTVVLPAG